MTNGGKGAMNEALDATNGRSDLIKSYINILITPVNLLNIMYNTLSFSR